MMSDDLFFLPMIAEALRQPDPRAALREAFDRIRSLGQEPRYRTGYEQFTRFMESVNDEWWSAALEPVDIHRLDELDRPTTIELVLERDDTPVAACSFEQASGTRTLRDIAPGHYCLRTDTGLVLWAGALTHADVIWARAFPDRDLPMAADTGASTRPSTRQVELLDGTLSLRVYPGLEAGTIEITFTAQGQEAS